MTASRKLIIKINSWYGAFVFPASFTAFEFLLIKFSPDGTAASIAYSQSDFLPLIQIASLTGILGITFTVTFIPSLFAIAWHYRKQRNKLIPLTIVSAILMMAVLLFGFFRLRSTAEKDTATTAGLIVLDEKTHKMDDNPGLQYEIQHIKNYAQGIAKLADDGAKIIVLPERAINISRGSDSIATNVLSNAARENHITIITGYTNYKNANERNSSLVIDANGNVVEDYDKVHLVKGLEHRFIPGSKIGLFKFNELQMGTAICKDLDFPGYIRRYGLDSIALICIPAWDFVTDDWLHSRMAILRGVENGFSEVRTARQGRLTISDPYGRVTAEANSSNGAATTLIGQVLLKRIDTIYTRIGDWFGIFILTVAVLFILIATQKKNVEKTNR